MSPKGPPFIFFSILHKNGCSKPPKGPLLQFFGTMRLTGDQKISKKNSKKFGFFKIFPHAGTVEVNTWHFEVLLLFLSLRYGADLGRSRLVHISTSFDFTPRLPFTLRCMAQFQMFWRAMTESTDGDTACSLRSRLISVIECEAKSLERDGNELQDDERESRLFF